MSDDVWPWVLRALWIAMPFTVGAAVSSGLDASSRPVQITGVAIAWIGWGSAVAILLIPSALSLTAARVIVPASLAAAIWGAAAGDLDTAAIAGLAITAAATFVAFSPPIGEWAVNGGAYGDELRIPLRPPGALLLGPLGAAWALIVGGSIAGPLLLASRQWVPGVLVCAIGFTAAFGAVRALHRLSRRWLVFVPAGVVVHDAMTVMDPVLFKRTGLTSIGPALAGSDAEDLTMGSLGLALEIRLRAAADLTLRTGRSAEARTTTAVTISAARPGHVLALAADRGLPVG